MLPKPTAPVFIKTLKLSSILTSMLVLIVSMTFVQCTSDDNKPNSTANEELRLLTPEQEKMIADNAERQEKKNPVVYTVKNEKGEVVSTVTSQTTVVYLKPGFGGGGRFSVNVTCVSSCTGTPIKLDPGGTTEQNSCHCDSKCETCVGAIDKEGCSGSCSKTRTGFGNFGIFIAMEKKASQKDDVAIK